jgi:hypothetical protein
MGIHTNQLEALIRELFASDQQRAVLQLARAALFQAQDLIALDESMPGLPFSQASTKAGSGAYHVDDRDVFRPLQYLSTWFPMLEREDSGDYATRFVVLMSSVHVEALVKRVVGESRSPLGKALQSLLARQRIPRKTHRLAQRFTKMYNDAKHEMGHEMDSHLFSRKDAVLAYFVARRLAYTLFPLTSLKTNWQVLTVHSN